MAQQKEREEFVAIMAREVPSMRLDDVRRLLRASKTLTRLAELECSSEAADRDRVRCPSAGTDAVDCLCRDYGAFDDNATQPHGHIPRHVVQSAAVEARVSRLCAAHNVEPKFAGDPRGCVLKLRVPSGFRLGQRGASLAGRRFYALEQRRKGNTGGAFVGEAACDTP